MGIELQGTPVRVPRLAGLDGLELESELVPVCGVQVAFGRARRLRRTSGDRCRPGREIGHREIEMRLARLGIRSEEHTSELQSRLHLVCRLLLEKKKKKKKT